MNSTFLIGVDAGGSKTVAAAYTPSGETVARICGRAGNITADPTAGCRAITDTVTSLISRLESISPRPALPLLCVGAAGASAHGEELQAALLRAYGERIGSIRVISDAELALLAAHGGDDGVLIISGTGSIGYRKAGDTLLRCGGWGHLLGDEGSGYDIAVCAIRAITRAADTGDTAPLPLRDAVFSHLGVNTLPQLISYVYSRQKSEIAALAPIVSHCAAQGDPTAQGILRRAGEQLADLADILLGQCPVTAPLSVACSGSVLTKSRAVRDAFEAALLAKSVPVSRIFDLPDPTVGVSVLFGSAPRREQMHS